MSNHHFNRRVPSLFRPFREISPFIIDDFFVDEENSNTGLSMYEDKDAIHVEAELPGLAKEDIQVTFEKGVLWIKGEAKEEKKEVKHHVRSMRSFSYRVPLPAKVDDGAVPAAQYKDGVLKVSFDKAKTSKPQQITIN